MKWQKKARSIGLGNVRIKVHDGTKEFRDASKAEDLANAMHSQNIVVLPWGYIYANFPEREAALIISYLHQPWTDGYIFDTEKDIESVAKWHNTQTLLGIVRTHRDGCALCRRKVLGFAPFAIPSLHKNLDYKSLVQYCDFIEPQMYWATMGKTVKKTVIWTYKEWLNWEKENGISKPLLPLGQTYDPHIEGVKNSLKSGEIVEFGKRTQGYYSISFWCWQQTSEDSWQEIQQVCHERSSGQSTFPSLKIADGYWWKNGGQFIASAYWPLLAVIEILGVIGLIYYGDTKLHRKRIGWMVIMIGILWPLLAVVTITCVVITIISLLVGAIIFYGKNRVLHNKKTKTK